MFHDLLQAGSKRQQASCDVVVIGAGLAGLVMASHLRQLGLSVIVLESGGLVQLGEQHPLNEVIQCDQLYRGAREGRFRCLGGTSTRWGGAMLPFLPGDLTCHPDGWDVDWPVSLDELTEHFVVIERLFNLPKGPYEATLDGIVPSKRASFQLRSAKWPSFRMRNVVHVLDKQIERYGLEIWLNATATEVRLDEAGRFKAVTARSLTENEITIDAAYCAIAAGAIESTRLLLLMDLQHGNRLFKPDGVLGKYFCDHLSAFAGRLTPVDRTAMLRQFGMRFEKGGMRDRRFEPTEALRSELNVPGGFAHIIAQFTEADGLGALRAIYRSIQRKSLPRPSELTPLVRNFNWFVYAILWRYLHRRLYLPRDVPLQLALTIEQMPHPANQISLSLEHKDLMAVPMAQIKWRVHEQDIATFRALQSAILSYWTENGFDSIATLEPTPYEAWTRQLADGGGIYHPAGSTRMGRSRVRGVVDAQLRTFAVPNLYVVSTSTFPSSGSANPSFMLLAFSMRAAKAISLEWRGKTT